MAQPNLVYCELCATTVCHRPANTQANNACACSAHVCSALRAVQLFIVQGEAQKPFGFGKHTCFVETGGQKHMPAALLGHVAEHVWFCAFLYADADSILSC